MLRRSSLRVPLAPSERSADVRSVLRTVRNDWKIVVALVLLFGAASLAYVMTLPKLYEAQATIEFDPDVAKCGRVSRPGRASRGTACGRARKGPARSSPATPSGAEPWIMTSDRV